MSDPEEVAARIGWKLVNDMDEMFARADIIWSDLDRFLAKQEEEWEDKAAATAVREFTGQMYDALLDNMHAISKALIDKPDSGSVTYTVVAGDSDDSQSEPTPPT